MHALLWTRVTDIKLEHSRHSNNNVLQLKLDTKFSMTRPSRDTLTILLPKLLMVRISATPAHTVHEVPNKNHLTNSHHACTQAAYHATKPSMGSR